MSDQKRNKYAKRAIGGSILAVAVISAIPAGFDLVFPQPAQAQFKLPKKLPAPPVPIPGPNPLPALVLDDRAEDSLGQSVAVMMVNQYGLVEDEKVKTYVNLIGLTLAGASASPDGNWIFGVLDLVEPQAFSGPNGYIMISKGVFQLTANEAELAGVLAHEMAHVTLHHGLQALKKKMLTDSAIQIFAKTQGAERQKQFNGLADAGVEVVGSQFSQSDEKAADREAVNILIAAGYDPNAYVKFLEKMAALDNGHGGLGTHPSSKDRVKEVKAAIAAAKYKGDGAILEQRYAENIAK